MKPPTEAEFLRAVIALAKLYGWRIHHQRPARTRQGWRTAVQGDGVGFPDALFLRGGTALACELKMDGGQATPAQEAWLAAFNQAGIKTFVWRPSDWPQIETTLESA